MSKKHHPQRDYAVYLVVRFVAAILQALPLHVGVSFARFLGWFAYQVDKRHREVARDNIRHAFPHLANQPERVDAMVRGCYHHFCLMLVELMFIPRRLHQENWRKYCSEKNLGAVLDRLVAERPLLIVTCHFGNWEVAGYVMGTTGFRSYAIARVLDNPHLEKYLKQFRQKTGQTILAKKGDFDQITSVMDANGKIATLGDQDAGPRGLFVDFFNRPASTHKAVALMSIQFNAPMVVVGVPRVGGPMQYEIICEEVIDPIDYVNESNAVKKMTERFTQAIERLVVQHPEQYFWLHRRWKHQPAAKTKPKMSAIS
ncbi:MAG: lysophospholipid acyltransferase family protein [Zavarzinella sp.]